MNKVNNKRKSDIEVGDKVRVTGNTCGHGFEVGSVVSFRGDSHDFNFIGVGVETWWLDEGDWEFVVNESTTFAQMTVSQRGELLTAYLDGKTIECQNDGEGWRESIEFPDQAASFLSYRIKPKPSSKIEVGGNYTSKCGDTWVCIFIKGDSAWLTNKGYGDAAYRFRLDGKAKCLGSNKKYDIDLTQQG